MEDGKSNTILGTIPGQNGAFFESLTRNNQAIKKNRAVSILEEAELIYRREIEDIKVEIRKLEMARENSLDLSPDNAMSLKVANEFDGKKFVETDIKLTMAIRNAKEKLDECEERYDFLFGKED